MRRIRYLLAMVGVAAAVSVAAPVSPASAVEDACKARCHYPVDPPPPPPPIVEECDDDGNCVCIDEFMDPGPGAPGGPNTRW